MFKITSPPKFTARIDTYTRRRKSCHKKKRRFASKHKRGKNIKEPNAKCKTKDQSLKLAIKRRSEADWYGGAATARYLQRGN